MKIFTLSPQRIIMILVMVFATNFAFAANFTAVTSGSWSSSATWGGTAPSNNISLDQITIPLGVIVTLDNTVTFNGLLSTLTVQGTLGSNATSSLIIEMGTLTGFGIISVNNLVLNSQASLPFTGTITTNTMSTAALNLQLAADITVTQTMTISGGIMDIVSGGSFDIGNNGTIVITGGLMSLNGGNVLLANIYNVNYTQGSSNSGLELSGAGLQNVTVDVGAINSVTLSSDLVTTGTLTLTSGNLILNNNNLTVNGNLASSGAGTITSTSTSNITLNTTTGGAGALTFTALGNDINNLTVNVGNNNDVALGSDLTINGTLNFTSGSINTNNNHIEITSTGSIVGAGSNSYVITGADGYLGIEMTSGGSAFVMFPVGTSSNYVPANIQLNSGSASNMMMVGVDADVMTQGTSGNDLSATMPVVDVTWFIEAADTLNVDANIQLTWATGLEVNSFNRTTAYVGHYTSGAWESASTISASTAVSGMFMLQANNLTSFSPFAVFGEGAVTAISEFSNDDVILSVYPNPTTERINIDFNGDINGIVNMDIVNIQGKVVGNYKLTGNETNVTVNQLPAGNYFIRFYNNDFNIVKKIVKL